MIDTKIIKDLGELLAVNVYAEKPADPPSEYVVIEFDKGVLIHSLGSMSIICDSYSTSMLNAASLNREVEKALFQLIGKPYIRDISRNTSFPANRTDRKEYRYKCNFNVDYYEED